MRTICSFIVVGVTPVPWAAAEIGTGTTAAGRAFRFVTRRRKTDVANRRPDLALWQKMVRDEAVKAMAGAAPTTGAIRLTLTFVDWTPPGYRHGECWFRGVSPREDRWVKGGNGEPDVTNLVKALEDALQGVVYRDDYQVREHETRCLYGPTAGVWVMAHALEATDCPGEGEPVRDIPPPEPARKKRQRKPRPRKGVIAHGGGVTPGD